MPREFPEVLVVEANPIEGESLCKLLQIGGFLPTWSRSAAEAREKYRQGNFRALLLNAELPDAAGWDFCREVHREDFALPILILSRRTDEETAVKSLLAGASDFVRIPFADRELILRLRNALNLAPGKISVGGLTVERDKFQVSCGPETIALPPAEFEALSLLAERVGRVVSHGALIDRMNPQGEMLNSSVKSHISRLKSKLRRARISSITIEAIYGEGYRLSQSPRP